MTNYGISCHKLNVPENDGKSKLQYWITSFHVVQIAMLKQTIVIKCIQFKKLCIGRKRKYGKHNTEMWHDWQWDNHPQVTNANA